MTQYLHDEQSVKPLFHFSVQNIIAYTWSPDKELNVSRINDVSKWFTKRRGRRIAENIYIFRKEDVPSYSDFKEAFSPLSDGEGIVVITSAKEALSLTLYGQPSPVRDTKIVVSDKKI